MMNMKRLIYILFILCAAVVSASASATVKPDRKPKKLMLEKAEAVIEDTLTNEYLDTIKIHKKLELNDYSMVGLQYGVGLSRVSWNPRQDQDMLLMPVNAGVLYTRYGKMFGYMPYFGFQAGVLYTTEGYQFKHNEEDNYTNKIEGAEKAVMDVVELPILAHLHMDFWRMKIIAEIGC